MPARYELSWDGKNGRKRWQKVHKGKRYVVSCKALGLSEDQHTKEGSRVAANAWWERKRAELDGAEPRPFGALLDELGRRKAWAQGRGDQPLTESLDRKIAQVESEGAGDLPPSILRTLVPCDPVWDDRLSRDQPQPVSVDRTIAHHVQRWLDGQKARANAHELSHAEAANRVFYLGHFRDWIGGDQLIDVLNEERWQAFYEFLLARIAEGKWSKTYAEKILRTARTFIESLSLLNLINAPRNLTDRRLRFTIPVVAVEVFTVEEIAALLKHATGQLRLHLLLMLNCGFTQQDISDLHPSEIDWSQGAITRKRSKTESHATVPVVRYKLWPETFQLLQTYRSTGDATHALRTEHGRLWVDKEGKDTDSIRTNYKHLTRKLKRRNVVLTKSLKYLRKTSASLLETNPRFSSVTTLFLGHSPRSIKDRHYVMPNQVLLDEALLWLRSQLGVAKIFRA